MTSLLAVSGEEAFVASIPHAQEVTVSGGTSPQRAFIDTIPKAQDGSVSAGRIGAAGCAINDGGKATFTKSRYKIKPSTSDFVADVQIAARRTLTVEEFTYFFKTYFVDFLGIADMNSDLDKTADGQDKFFVKHLEQFKPEAREHITQLDKRVRTKLGAALIDRGIYPYSYYMNHADADVRKRFE